MTEKDILNSSSCLAFIASNIRPIYLKTKSTDIKKYYILLIQIIKKRLETKCLTRTNLKKKEIISKQKKLREEELVYLELLLKNKEFLLNRCNKLIIQWEKNRYSQELLKIQGK